MFSRDLAPVPAKVASELGFSQNFYPVVEQDLKRNGQYFGVPLEIDGLGLFVNEEIFRAAGATYPTTWEELRTTALKLTVKDQDGKIMIAGVALGETSNIEHWSDILGLMMLQNGVDLTNPTGNLAEDALVYFTLFSKLPDNTWDETLDNSILAFAKGQVAMIFAPSWQAFEIKNINPNLSFKILPVPQLPGSNISWVSYWVEGVWAKSKNQEQAWEFLKYLVSKEAMTKLYSQESKIRLFGEPYSRIDLGQTLVSDPYVGAFISQAANARSFYLASRTFDNGINDKIIKYFEDAVDSLDKGVSPTAALETAARGVSQVLSTYGVSSSSPAQR
ncbi:extracellular solute-binding protein [Candidatus Gottesmanbacteria bacterium]|nr:extracellular solute-binding protein [Candidatus Gottesmanbacteria bacterium]